MLKASLTYNCEFLIDIDTRVVSILRQNRNLLAMRSVHAVRRWSLAAKMVLVD
jgi:hypothetical protein